MMWKNSIEQNIDVTNVPMIIIQNKCDLLGNESEYNKDVEELKEFGKKNGVVNCFRTSALNGYGIKECMDFLINEIIKVTDFTDIESEENNADNFDISDEPRSIRGKNSGCC